MIVQTFKKNASSLPTLVFIYLSNQQKCSKFKGVYTHNKTNVLQTTSLQVSLRAENRRKPLNVQSSKIARLWSQQVQYASSYLYKRLSFFASNTKARVSIYLYRSINLQVFANVSLSMRVDVSCNVDNVIGFMWFIDFIIEISVKLAKHMRI